MAGRGPAITSNAEASAYLDAPAREAFGIRTYAVAPIVLEDGQVFGTLCVLDSEEVAVSEEQRAVLVALSRLIARVHDDALRKASLRGAVERQAEAVDAMLDVASRLDRVLAGDLPEDTRGELDELRRDVTRAREELAHEGDGV